MTSPAPEPVTLFVSGAVAIPVGHRVEVVVLEWTKILGPMTKQPLITDLDTGITYGALSHFRTTGSDGLPYRTLTTVLPEIHEHSRWAGRVLLCQVLDTGNRTHETTLVIEPDSPTTTPYR